MIQTRRNVFYRLTLAFIFGGLVPLLIAGTMLFYRFKGDMEQVILDDMGRTVGCAVRGAREMVDGSSSLTKHMYDIYTEDDRLLYQLLKDKSMADQEKRIQMALFLGEMLEEDSRIRTASFVDREGRIYYATRNMQKALDETAFRQWISQEGYSGEAFSALPTHADSYFPDSGNQVLTFRRSYQDLTSFKTIGISLGNLYLDVDVGNLSSALGDRGVGENGTFSIIDKNGICIYSMDGSEMGKPLERMVPYLSSMTETRGYLTDARRHVVYERMDGSGWIVAAQVGRDAVMSSLNGTVQCIVAFLSGTFLVLLCLYSYSVKHIWRTAGLLEHEENENAVIVESLSRQVEYLSSGGSMVPLKKEIGNIRDYFYTMGIQYENRIQLEVSADEDVMDASIIRMSLQPVVENAVRHGLLPKKGDGTVSIEARRKDSILEVTVMDDGVGMTEETLADLNAGPDQDGTDVQTGDKGLDTGIRNVHDRIRRTFGPGYGLKIMSNEGKGTVVVFCLPFIPDKAEPEEEGNAQQGSDGTSSDRICE